MLNSLLPVPHSLLRLLPPKRLPKNKKDYNIKAARMRKFNMYRNPSIVIPQLRTYLRDRSGFSGENLKRHILAMSQGVEILNDGPFSTTLDTLLYNDPQFQVF